MLNPIPKFRQNSTITVTLGYLSEKSKTLASSNYQSIFFADILHTSPTSQCLQKGVRDFFYLFICYFAAPQPTLGHYQWGNLANLC